MPLLMMGGVAPFGMPMVSGWMWVLVLLLVGLIVFAVVAAARPPHAPRHEGSALDVLDERYARGEIGREEYERIRSDLRRSA